MIRSKSRFELDWFEWSSKIPDQLLSKGGYILQLHKEGKTWIVHEPERFLRVESENLHKRYQIVHAEYPCDYGSITLKKLKALYPKSGKKFDVTHSKLVRENGIVSELRNLIRNS